MSATRTSNTDPIKVAYVSIEGVEGKIGITLCPGKQASSYHGTNWERNLEADIATLKMTNPAISTIVTLVETWEMNDLLKVPELLDTYVAEGYESIHLPIIDTTPPTKEWLLDWNIVWSPILENRLYSGDDVLIHCRGGLGRAGTVAALLLMEMGIEVSEAIAKVRKSRSMNAINPSQEHFLNQVYLMGFPQKGVKTRLEW